MNKQHCKDTSLETQWNKLQDKYNLSEPQRLQLQRYLTLLIDWNKNFNLTAITDPSDIMSLHFEDSLALAKEFNFSHISMLADVGTGAGFPGIPLKIAFPHLSLILIEVNNKKRSFLSHVIQELGLSSVIIYEYEWRNFLRTTDYQIDLFCARASLQPEELIRIFKPSSAYQHCTLVYWASQKWIAEKPVTPFIEKEISYTIDDRERKFIFFNHKK